MRRFVFWSCLALTFTVMTACTTGKNPAGAPVPQLTFENVQAVPIRVAVVEMTDRSTMKRALDDRSNDFITPPLLALERYFKQRFNPSAFEGQLNVIVDQAGVLVTQKEKPEGWLAQLTDWASRDLYTVSMTVLLEASNGAATELKLHRQAEMPQNPSLAERELFLQSLVEGIIVDLDMATMNAMAGTLDILALPVSNVRPLRFDGIGGASLPVQTPVIEGAQATPQPQITGANASVYAEPIDLSRPQSLSNDQSQLVEDTLNDSGTQDYTPVVPSLSTPESWGQQYQ